MADAALEGGGAGLKARLTEALAACLAVLAAWAAMVPFSPQFLGGAEVDASWRLYLNEAFARGLVHGRDVIFTYGPWGIAGSDVFYPGTFGWLIAFRAAWSGCCAAAMWRLGGNLRVGAWWRAAWVFACLLWGGAGDLDGVALATCLVPALLRATGKGGRWDRLAEGAAIAAMGMAGLVKFTWMLGAATAVALLVVDDVRRRRWPWAAGWFAAAVLGFWALAGQPADGLPRHLYYGWQVAGGYGAAMSTWAHGRLAVVSFALLSLAVLAEMAWAGRAGRARWLGIVTLAAMLFLAFKAGEVRDDAGHHRVGMTAMASFATLLLPALWVARPGRAGRAVGAAVLCASAACLVCVADRPGGELFAWRLAEKVVGSPGQLWAGVRYVSGAAQPEYAAQFRAAMEKMRQATSVPELSGTVDVLGYEQGAAIAHGLALRARPVPQGYSAYTPELAEANAAFFRGPEAPEYVLYRFLHLDAHFPAMDDGLAVREILSRYDVVGAAEPYVVLRRSAAPRAWSLEALSKVEARLGQAVELPDPGDALLWAEIRVSPTLLGRAGAALLRDPVIWMTARGEDGAALRCRLVPGMASAGFVLSPMVRSSRSFGWLQCSPAGIWREASPPSKLRSISLSVEGEPLGKWVRPAYSIAFGRLSMGWAKGPMPSPTDPNATLLAMGASASPEPTDRLQADEQGRPAIFAHPPCRMRLPIEHGERRLSFGHGLLPPAWDKTEGVVFRISAVGVDGRAAELWRKAMTPGTVPADRATVLDEVALPEGTAAVEFETSPVGATAYCWAHWADVRLR